MNKQKLIATILASSLMVVSLVGCGNQESSSSANAQTVQTSSNQSSEIKANGKVLVVYFTYAENANLPDNVDASTRASVQKVDGKITGNTALVASQIQKDLNADIFSIQTVNKYPATYDETVNVGKQEQAEKARPQLATKIDNIADYDTIFIGYPNWWGDMPMALYSFFEQYDLSGKKIIPFSTSGGSGLSNTVDEIKQLEPNATVEGATTFSAQSTSDAKDEVSSWLKDINYLQ